MSYSESAVAIAKRISKLLDDGATQEAVAKEILPPGRVQNLKPGTIRQMGARLIAMTEFVLRGEPNIHGSFAADFALPRHGHSRKLDHEALLAKYIAYIGESEGANYITDIERRHEADVKFTDEEWTDLERLAAQK